ncbi:MAG: alpha/beta hydrolase [Nocardioidaceae bacterium]
MAETPHGVEIPGPWQHRHVAANGARFHVVEAGPATGPPVLLLHGFPQFWWAWRHQLPVLADAGHRAVAMDLRGYGGSDKTPDGYDPVTLAGDVAAVIKALGARDATVVGHGWGGYVGWAAATIHPREVRRLCTVAAPHPLAMLSCLRRGRARTALRHLLVMQVPMLPERRLAAGSGAALRDHLSAWSAPGSGFPDEQTLATYQRAISLWPSSHCALEYHRWLLRSRLRSDGHRFDARMRVPVEQPVCLVSGGQDPAVPVHALDGSRRYVRGPLREHRLAGAGHFAPEEDPQRFAEVLLDWLAETGPPG